MGVRMGGSKDLIFLGLNVAGVGELGGRGGGGGLPSLHPFS